MASMLVVQRELHGSGFHLTLQTSVNTTLASMACSHWAMVERLPRAVFFDPFKLARLAERGALGGAQGVAVLSKTSIESFAAHSEQAVAVVYGSFVANTLDLRAGAQQTIHSEVPVHLRYDSPSQNQTHRRCHQSQIAFQR